MTWLLGWNFRKSKTVNGTTFGSQINYTLQLNVFKGSGTDTNTDIYLNNNCNDDFSDIRFTSSDGLTPLDYYIESMIVGVSAIIDIEINSIPEDPGSTNIYIYYGNLTAVSESNAANTFLLYDTFTNLNNWEKLLGTIRVYSSSMLYLLANSMATTKNSIPLNCEIKYYIYGYGNAYYAPEDTLRDIKLAKETTQRDYCRFSQTYGNWSYVSRNTSEGVSQTFSLSPLTGHTAIIRHTLNGNWVLLVNGVTVQTQPSLRTSSDVLYLHFSSGGYPSLIAYTIIRKYASPEPTFGVTGAEETAMGDVCIKSNPSGASITIDGTLYPKTTALSGTSCILDNTVIGLLPGANNHSYQITLIGYEPKTGSFSIAAGILTEIDVGNLVLIPTTGDVCIKSNPSGASITIDGTLYPKTTALSGTSCILDNTVIGLLPGINNHSYQITLIGYEPKTGSFSITADVLTQVEVGDLVPITSAGGGGLALLSLGLLFGLILTKKKCGDKHTKEECEQTGCQWKDGICIERK